MSQYKLGTCSVITNNATVNFTDASSGAENVAIGDSFKVDRDGEVIYQISSRTPSSGASLTSVVLSVVYGGTTGSGLGFQITTDFTTNRSYPELAQGDADAADWLTAALRKIDQDMGNLFGQVGALAADEVLFWNGTVLDSDPTFKYNNTNKQLRLSQTGSAAGLLIGGDAQWYRSAADIMRTPDSLVVDGTVTVSGAGPHAIGGATNDGIQWFQRGAFTPASGTTTRGYHFGATLTPFAANGDITALYINPGIQEFGSGVHALISGIEVTFAVTAGTATTTTLAGVAVTGLTAAAGTTNAAAIYVSAAPTGATNNYALWVAAGNVRLGDGFNIGWITDVTTGPSIRGQASHLTIRSGTTGIEFVSQANVARALLTDGGMLLVGDTSNANMTVGLTLNQGASDNQIFACKSSDVAHALTTAGNLDVETDDFLAISKWSAAEGGAALVVIREDGGVADVAFWIEVLGGTPETADTTTSLGLMNTFIAEHDGANALANAPANANIFTIQSWSAGARTTRLLLKGDDGELHLGNTTLVALDSDDDPQYVRALIYERSRGQGVVPDPYYKPTYDYEALKRIGVVGEKDSRGEYLIRVQPYLGLHDMAIWQLYIQQKRLETAYQSEIADLRGRLQTIEGRA